MASVGEGGFHPQKTGRGILGEKESSKGKKKNGLYSALPQSTQLVTPPPAPLIAEGEGCLCER